MTSYLTFYDSAWPPAKPPETDGVCGYIGGDTPYVWKPEDWAAQKARYRLPVFVRSNPRGITGVASDVNAALRGLAAIDAPRGILVAFDLETAADALYVGGVYAGMAAHGYRVIVYGSQADVFGNKVPDGLYFSADWTGTPHMARGAVMTQWVSFAAYDEDIASPSLPFWDAQAAAPKPPVKAAAPAVREWTTAGEFSLAELAAQQHTTPSEIIRLTLQHSGNALPAEVAGYVDAAFTEKMPAGLRLWVPG